MSEKINSLFFSMNQYNCVALQTLDNTEGTIKNGQSRGIFIFGHTRHRIKTIIHIMWLLYQNVLDKWLLLTRKLLNQRFKLVKMVKLKSSLRTMYGRHHDLIKRYGISVSQMTMDMFHLS